MTRIKSQTSTEYLVILAVVIVVALMSVNILGGFPGIGAGADKKIDDYKLRAGEVSIASYEITGYGSVFKLKNNYYDILTVSSFRVGGLNNLTCNSSNTNPALPIQLNVGEEKIISCDVVNSSSYPLTNRQSPIIGVTYLDSMGVTRTTGNDGNYSASGDGGEESGYGSEVITALRNGLVGYWPLDGNASDYGESGGMYNGTTSGDVIFGESGKVGTSASFDGNLDYISFSTSSFPLSNTDRSICAWAKFSSLGGSDVILGYGDVNGIAGSQFQLQSDPSGSLTFMGAYCDYTTETGVVSEGTWNFVCITFYDEDSISFYVNGTFIDNTSALGCVNTLDYATGVIGINVQTQGGVSEFDGLLDEVAIWNRSLSATEISQLYNSGNGLSLIS